METFTGKVAAITGAASGIGRTLALELARRGCHLALSDIDDTGLGETAEMARRERVNVSTSRIDVADRDSVYAWADAVATTHGKVNLIFNNAGVGLSVHLDVVSQTDFEWIMGINFWGVVYGTQAFLPHLKMSGDGHVINMSSVLGMLAMPSQGAYSASKFAVRGYTEALRMELDLANEGVSATCVHPGGVATNIVKSGRIDPSMAAQSGMTTDTQRAHAEGQIKGTTAESAALQILTAVERNDRRVVIGKDARLMDTLVRLMGARYQAMAVRQHARMFPKV